MLKPRALGGAVRAAVLAGMALLYVESGPRRGGEHFAGMLSTASPPRPWILLPGGHWQIASTSSEEPGVTDFTEGTRGACSEGMVYVAGLMKKDGIRSVEDLQDETCVSWISRDFPARCEKFDPAAWRALASPLATRALRFCIDRFEYPNRKGQFPVIEASYHEAAAACETRGARLCTEDEWTFACEGDEALPYPYGYVRNAETCVIDRPWRAYDDRALSDRASNAAMFELDYLWQGEPSGSRPGCRSPAGVYDMTGNVDEVTRSVQRDGYRSVFKGGYWGPIRARCRPSTRAHNEDFSFYQQGFRCCTNPPLEAGTDGGADFVDGGDLD